MRTPLLVLALLFGISFSSNAQLSTLGPAGATAGVNDWVYTLHNDTASGLLYVGGDFTTAGNVFSPFIAAWDGTNWFALGTGLNGAARTTIMFEGDLYVGGEFTEAGGIPVNGIAKWDGTNWSAVGDGFDNDVLSLCIFNNELYAGGRFSNTGSSPAKGIAKWNGTAWQEVGGGLEATGSFDNYDAGVVSMTVMQNQLYVGGYFNEGNNGQDNFDGNLVRWNGFSWQDIPSSFGYSFNVVWTMKERNGILWVAGVGTPYIRTFDGVNWLTGALSPLPQYTVNGDVYTLGYYDGYDIVGGGFQGVGINQIGNDVLFEEELVHGILDEEWYSFDGGVNNSVFCTEVYQDELYIGGSFTRTNNGFVQCNHIVRWRSPLVVDAVKEDAFCDGVEDGSIILVPANGQAPYTYEWADIGMGSDTRTDLPSGTYSVTITDAIGREETRSFIVGTTTALTLNFDVTNTSGTNGEIELAVTGGAMPYQYDWNTGATTANITDLAEGAYTVDVEDANGCIASGSASVDTLVNSSITEASAFNWKLYPNPAADVVYVSSEKASGQYITTIYNMVGKLVTEQKFMSSGINSSSVDVSFLDTGTYVIAIHSKQGAIVYRQKFLKE